MHYICTMCCPFGAANTHLRWMFTLWCSVRCGSFLGHAYMLHWLEPQVSRFAQRLIQTHEYKWVNTHLCRADHSTSPPSLYFVSSVSNPVPLYPIYRMQIAQKCCSKWIIPNKLVLHFYGDGGHRDFQKRWCISVVWALASDCLVRPHLEKLLSGTVCASHFVNDK